MKNMKTKFITVIVIAFVISAYTLSCAPKAQEVIRAKPSIPVIDSNDVNLLQMHKKPFADFQFSKTVLKTNNANLMNESYYLAKIGHIVGDEIAIDTAKELFKKSTQKAVAVSIPMSESRYLTLVEQQSSEALSAGLNETEKVILSDTEKINAIIDQNAGEVKSVTELTDFTLQLSIAELMIQKILMQIQQTELFPELKTQVLAELSTQTTAQLAPPKSLAANLKQVKTLTEAVAILNKYILDNQTVLTPEDQMSLKNGAALGVLIDKIHDPESAMAALAMAWSMLTAEERITSFKSANVELYDFLRKKDESEIKCLINESCKGIIKKIILKVGVYPALKDYGVGNVKKDLTDNSLLSVHAIIQKQSSLQITTLGEQIKEKIRLSITEKLTSLQDFKSKFKITIGEGLANKLGMNKIDLFENTDFSDMFKDGFNQAENLSSKSLDTQFVLVEKMLQFMKLGTTQTSAPESTDIKTVLKLAEPRFYVQKPAQPDAELITRAKDQAWSLMFYSKMIQQLADWKITSYDEGLTKVLAQDFITDFQSPELSKKLFPKEELIGMALSLAAQTLKQMYTDKSPIYLLDKDNNRVSIKQYVEENYDSTNNIVVHAAVSNLKNGMLADDVNLADITLMIESMNSFYEATNGIELSQSESLKDPVLNTEVLNARKQIKLVIMTLANFISNQLVDKQKNLYTNLNFQTEVKTISDNSKEYAHAIDALLTAYHLTGIDIYKFTAIEIYYSLNKKFYSTKIKFYHEFTSETKNNVSKEHVLEVLSSIIGIRKFLGLTSQMQFDRIFENWYAAILM